MVQPDLSKLQSGFRAMLTVLQVKWCSQVFTDPVSIIADLLSDMLFSLRPRLAQSFDIYMTSSGLAPVTALIALRQVINIVPLSVLTIGQFQLKV